MYIVKNNMLYVLLFEVQHHQILYVKHYLKNFFFTHFFL